MKRKPPWMRSVPGWGLVSDAAFYRKQIVNMKSSHVQNIPRLVLPNIRGLTLSALGIGACALLAMCILGLGVVMKLGDIFLPVYNMDQVDSVHEGFRRTTLTHDNTIYVNDYEEYALLPINTEPPQMIGRLPFSEDAVSGVYAIPGQDPSAYALEYDPMYQLVYRNVEHPPFDWLNADFQKLRVMFPTANLKETEDAKVINNVRTTLIGAAIMIVPFQQDGNYSGYENSTVLLLSDELPGLMYAAGMHVAADGTVYLAENMVTNIWHPAGSVFVEWLDVQNP